MAMQIVYTEEKGKKGKGSAFVFGDVRWPKSRFKKFIQQHVESVVVKFLDGRVLTVGEIRKAN